jgi:phosphoglucomutase
MDKMRNIMTKLRKKPIRVIGDLAVQYIEDYLSRISTAADGKVSDIQLPAANAVKLILERSAWICIRPSGTEPKIKIYYAVREAKRKAAESQLKNIANSFEQMI